MSRLAKAGQEYIPNSDGATSSEIAEGKEYPFVEDTLGKKLEAGTSMSVDGLTCRRKAQLDIAEPVKRFGADYGCMHWDLLKIIYCRECRGAGREDRNLQFTNHAAGAAKGLDALSLDLAASQLIESTSRWREFCQCEHELDRSLSGQKMVVLCTYSLSKSWAVDLLDVARAHQFTITRRKGNGNF